MAKNKSKEAGRFPVEETISRRPFGNVLISTGRTDSVHMPTVSQW